MHYYNWGLLNLFGVDNTNQASSFQIQYHKKNSFCSLFFFFLIRFFFCVLFDTIWNIIETKLKIRMDRRRSQPLH